MKTVGVVWERIDDGTDQNSESSLEVGTVGKEKERRLMIAWLRGIRNSVKEKHLRDGHWDNRDKSDQIKMTLIFWVQEIASDIYSLHLS